MEAEKGFKPDKEIVGQIQSGDEDTNLSVIEKLRVTGKSGYLPYLFELARTTDHPAVGKAVFRLLDDLKDKSAIPFIIEALTAKENKPILKELVESCWENGLDYSGNLPVFVDLLIHESDETSFEAFTVIENMELLPGDEFIVPEIKKLKANLSTVPETRQYFLLEAIKILSAVTG